MRTIPNHKQNKRKFTWTSLWMWRFTWTSLWEGTPKSALRSSVITMEWALARAILASSQTLDAREPIFSFPLAMVLCLFRRGVSSSREVVGEVVLMALGTETVRVTEISFSMTRTTFFPRLEMGLFFLAFILVYISWLNLVVISM